MEEKKIIEYPVPGKNAEPCMASDADVILKIYTDYKNAMEELDFWKSMAQGASLKLEQIEAIIRKEQCARAKSGAYTLEQVANPYIEAEELKPIVGMGFLCVDAEWILKEKNGESIGLLEDDEDGSAE